MCSAKRRSGTIGIIAESVGDDVRTDTVSTRINAEVSATTVVNQTFIDPVWANPTVELAVVHNATVDNFLK